ncbi:MAG: hypothetical protein J6D21_12660 [Clostridia bacterium]|nr:hypothetical protein [Clostridia bacterium]
MAKVKNAVIAGDYTGRKVLCAGNRIIFDRAFESPVEVSSATVDRYEVIDQESSKSLGSAFGRGLIGNALFGTVGMVAGALSAKNTTAIVVSIEFKNGDKSLIEIDQKIYKVLLKILFS